MYERFADEAKRIVFFARYEADKRGAASIGTEHLLLGILRDDKRFTPWLLKRRELSVEDVTARLEARLPRVDPFPSSSGQMPLSSGAKQALERAPSEARLSGVDRVAPCHIFAAVTIDPSTEAARFLQELGIGLEELRSEVVEYLRRLRPDPVVEVVWEFVVKSRKESEFEAHYGPGGTWAKLFRKSPEYLGTTLAHDIEHPGRYILVDRWNSLDAFESFKEAHQAAYDALDRAGAELTEREVPLGVFGPLR